MATGSITAADDRTEPMTLGETFEAIIALAQGVKVGEYGTTKRYRFRSLNHADRCHAILNGIRPGSTGAVYSYGQLLVEVPA